MAEGMADARKLVKTRYPGIYRRGDRFQVRTTVHGRSVIKSFRTQTEARRYKNRLDNGDRPTSSQPFRNYADEWIASYRGRRGEGISETTRAAYKDALDRFAKPFFASEKLDRIGDLRIQEFIDHLAAQGLTPGSIRKYLAPVKVLFATAVTHELLNTNPTREVVVAVADKREAKPMWLSPEQTKALLAEIPDRHVDLVFLLATAGLRISEGLNVRWRDLVLSGQPSLTVTKSKTRAGERTLPLSPETARRLIARRATANYARDDDLAFPTRTGEAMDPHNFRSKVFRKAAERASVPWATPHKLRHGLASLMAAQGLGASEIAAYLGHADGGTLALKTYIHPDLTPIDFVDSALTD